MSNDETLPKVVIEMGGENGANVYSDSPLDVVLINTDEQAIQTFIEGGHDYLCAPIIPADVVDDPDNPENFGLFEQVEVEINEGLVSEVFDFVQDKTRRRQYGRLVKSYLSSDDEDEEGQDE